MNIQKWKVLKAEDVSPSKWFLVERNTVQLPSGKIIDDYYLSRLGNVAMVLAVTQKHEIVFVKQYKHGLGEVVIELPAGFQQKNKSIEESAVAELVEEAGIQITIPELKPLGKIANNPTKTYHVTHGFYVSGVEFNSKQSLDTTEEIEVICLSPSRVLQMIKNGEIWVGDTVALVLRATLVYPEIFR